MFGIRSLFVLPTLVAVAMFAMTGLAHGAADLGVNFDSDPNALSASDSAGVVARDNWNNINSGNGTVSNLTLSDGSASTASVNVSSSKGFVGNDPGGTGPSNTMLTGYLDAFGSNDSVTATVSGMDDVYGSGAAYDVYVYVNQDKDFRTGLVTLSGFDSFSGDTTFYTTGTDHFAGNDWKQATTTTVPTSSTDVTIANYVLFSGVTGDSFTIEGYGVGVNDDDGRLRQGITGVQTIIPEPVSLALLGLGGLGLLVRRRRA